MPHHRDLFLLGSQQLILTAQTNPTHTMTIKTNLIALALVAGLTITAHGQTLQTVFFEDFGNLANTTTITTANTDLTYVRVGTGGGSIAALNPSSFSGASALITGPSNTSLNGIGATGFDAEAIYEMSFDFRLSNTTGNMVIGVGDGNSFTGNTTFSTAQGLFWLQIIGGQLQRRTNSWVDVGDALSANTNYTLRVIANGSASDFNYDSTITLSAGRMDIYLGSTLIADNVAVTNSLDSTAFRIYSVSGSTFELDNISISAIPEPSTYAGLFGLAVLGLAIYRSQLRK
jgi:hypothetical protein